MSVFLNNLISTELYKVYDDYKNKNCKPGNIQLVSVGDVCLIGVPGELVAELGLEMKWHSPFRKTFIL